MLSAGSRLSDRVLEDIIKSMSKCQNLLNNAIKLNSEWYNVKGTKSKKDAVNGFGENHAEVCVIVLGVRT